MSWLDGAEEIPTTKKAKAGESAPSWMEGAEEVTPRILPDSPLAQALAANPDAETVDIDGLKFHTGKGNPEWKGRRIMSPEEFEKSFDAGAKLGGLQGTLSFMAGGGKGLTDDMAGYWEALKSIGTDEDAADAHYRGKTNAQRLINEADDVGPKAYGVPVLPVLGAMVSSGPTAASWLPRIAAGGYSGALQGLGDSEKSGTGLLKDAGESALFSSAVTAGGEAVGGVAKGVGKYFGNKAAVNEGKRAAIDLATVEKAALSDLGTAGKAGQTVHHKTVEYIDKVLANPSQYSDEVIALANARNLDPEIIAARSEAAMNALRGLPGDVAHRQETAAKAAESMSTIKERAAALTARQLDPWEQVKDFTGKAWNSVGQRVALAAGGGAVGYVAGDALGYNPLKSGLAGLAAPGVLSFTRNQLKNPARWSALQRGLEGLSNASATGAEGLEATAGRRLALTAAGGAAGYVAGEKLGMDPATTGLAGMAAPAVMSFGVQGLTGPAVRGIQEAQQQQRKGGQSLKPEDETAVSAFLSLF
jgi:hypothetical protein